MEGSIHMQHLQSQGTKSEDNGPDDAVNLQQLLIRSGKREIHPYVRPGICTILISLTCFFASLIAFNTTSKYDEKICANQTKPESRLMCFSYIQNGRLISFGLVIAGIVLLVLGICCSTVSVCHLLRKTLLREAEANEKLRHYCKETLKPKGTTISMCTDHPSVDSFANSSKKRSFFRWSGSISWKSFSKSVLIEPEETQFQNEMLFKEISKVMTRKKSIKEEEENPLKPVTESTYFKLPFKKRLEIEEMIKRVALEGITMCSCHKCSLCHCHLRGEQALLHPETPDFSDLNIV